jgi:hypothetical protein
MNNKLELMKKIWELTKADPDGTIWEGTENMYPRVFYGRPYVPNEQFPEYPYYSESWLWRELPKKIEVPTYELNINHDNDSIEYIDFTDQVILKNEDSAQFHGVGEDLHTALLELFIWVVENGYWRKDEL